MTRDEAAPYFDVFVANMTRLAALPGAGALVAVAPTDIDGTTRWWRCPAYDLVLTSGGTFWLLWPVGEVRHPPLFGLAFSKGGRAILDQIAKMGGAAIPRGFPGTEALERLVAGPDDVAALRADNERLRGIVERNKARYLALQARCRDQETLVRDALALAREAKERMDQVVAASDERAAAYEVLRREIEALQARMLLPGQRLPEAGEA